MIDDSIFRANDIRGVFNAGLDSRAAFLVGRACGEMARAKGFGEIAVGRDGRKSGPELCASLARGLSAGGMRVFDIGVAPTPAVYHAAVVRFGGNGAVVTGSHNPKAHNGMKIMQGGAMLSGDAMRELRERVAKLDESGNDSGGDMPVPIPDATDEYVAAVVSAIGALPRKLKIVLDAGNGAAGECAPRIFRALGCETTELFCEIDGDFPNHHPDPARPENLSDAIRMLSETNGDAAFAFDGDGDRLGVVLPESGMVFADRLLMLFARDLLSRVPGSRVVCDVKCTSRFAPWVRKLGGVPDMQPTGHAFIKARMRETGAPLGGEMSGHFYFKENWFGFDDALFAGARLAKIFAESQSPDAAMSDIPELPATPELNAPRPSGDQREFIARLSESAKFPGASRIVRTDGLRVEYPDGFGLARASNTTASLVFRFEGETPEALRRIQSAFRRELLSTDPKMTPPF